MKIHLEFNNTAEMVAYSKFILEAATPQPTKDAQTYMKSAEHYMAKTNSLAEENKRLNKLLDRAYARLRMADPKGETANKEEPKPATEGEVRLKKALEMTIEDLELTVRSENCLRAENILTIGQLVTHTEYDLAKIPNLGAKSRKDIREQLFNKFKLTLRKA